MGQAGEFVGQAAGFVARDSPGGNDDVGSFGDFHTHIHRHSRTPEEDDDDVAAAAVGKMTRAHVHAHARTRTHTRARTHKHTRTQGVLSFCDGAVHREPGRL